MSKGKYFDEVVKRFHKHYKKRLKKTKVLIGHPTKTCTRISIRSSDLKDGNEPRLYLHKKKKAQVVVLTHGLSDSPHYLSAIAKRFFAEGANVLLPLLPAHGLKDPDLEMEDYKLDAKWRHEIDVMTELAKGLGEVISLGGFSAGGAISYNKVLRDESKINGGLFLFAAAIDVRLANEVARLKFLSGLVKIADGKIEGYGRNPFKYPRLPQFGALELGEIINENIQLAKRRRISIPTYAAHSVHDVTAKLSAVIKLLKKHVHVGAMYTVSHKVLHGNLTLDRDIPADNDYEEGSIGYANPDFDLMMDSCIAFYRKYIVG